MTYKYATFYKWVSVCTDYLLLNLALFIVFVFNSPDLSIWDSSLENYRLSFLILNLLWFYCSSLLRIYDNLLARDSVPTVRRTVVALGIYFAVSFILTVTLRRFSYSTEFFFYSFLLFSGFISVARITFLSVRKTRRKFWIRYKKIIIIGTGKTGKDLYKYVNENPQLGYKVAGMFGEERQEIVSDMNLKYQGGISSALQFSLENGISEIFCALSGSQLEEVQELMQEADHHMIRFRLVPDLKFLLNENIMLELYGKLPVLTYRNEPLENKANELMKRAFDFSFALLVSVFILSWLIPIIGVIIKLDSKGPVFFRQLRSGKNNQPFYCYKFRSMQVNSESDSLQATKGDARVTRVGAFLRKTSLDELPQFINVLLGDMSVVGPRPHMLKHTQDYSMLIGNFMVRHFLTPGITGWAQVSGYRGETKETEAMNKRVEADIWYLENWTFFLDLKIIFLTVWNSLSGKDKAY